jgi:hypothetical protein
VDSMINITQNQLKWSFISYLLSPIIHE